MVFSLTDVSSDIELEIGEAPVTERSLTANKSGTTLYKFINLMIRKEISIDSKIRKTADEIDVLQNQFDLLNRLSGLVHNGQNDGEVDQLLDKLKDEHGVELPHPRNDKEAFRQSLMTHVDEVKFGIQGKINSIHPDTVDKSALIQLMHNVIKLDGGTKKMVENQRTH